MLPWLGLCQSVLLLLWMSRSINNLQHFDGFATFDGRVLDHVCGELGGRWSVGD